VPINAEAYRDSLNALGERYLRFLSRRSTDRATAGIPDTLLLKRQMHARYLESRDRFLELFVWLEEKLGAEFVATFLREIKDHNQKVMYDSMTEQMLQVRLGCYDCRNTWTEQDIGKHNMNLWCKKYDTMPNLMMPVCPKFKKSKESR
jgi:hypothetical protein